MQQFSEWWCSEGLSVTRNLVAQSLVEEPKVLAWSNKWKGGSTVLETIDDDSRVLADKNFAAHLESYLIRRFIEIFTSGVPFEVISIKQWSQSLESVVTEARIRDVSLYLDPGFDDNRASEYRMIELSNTQTYLDARYRGELVDLRDAEFRELATFLRSPKHIVGLLFDNDDLGFRRCLVDVGEVCMDEETGNPFVQFRACYLSESDIVSRILSEHVQAVVDKHEQFNPGCIVTLGDLHHITDTLSERVISENHCLYLKIDLFDFILGNKSNYKFGFQKYEAVNQPLMTAVWGQSNYQNPKYVLKCLPPESARLLFSHLARRVDIDLVKDEAPPMIAEAIRLVTNYWSVL